MSAIALPLGSFDVAGRTVKQLPFSLAVQVNATQERLEANGLAMILICKDCHKRTDRLSQSIVEGDFDGGNSVTMTCACTKRTMTLGA